MTSGPQVVRPVLVVLGVDLEEKALVLVRPADRRFEREGCAANADRNVALPLAAALLVLSVDEVIAILQLARPQDLALAGLELIPALGDERLVGRPLGAVGRFGNLDRLAGEIADAKAVLRGRFGCDLFLLFFLLLLMDRIPRLLKACQVS